MKFFEQGLSDHHTRHIRICEHSCDRHPTNILAFQANRICNASVAGLQRDALGTMIANLVVMSIPSHILRLDRS
jgi:hypothetical protein